MSYVTFYKLDSLVNGLISFKELELLDGNIHVGDVTYNTAHIVSLKSKIISKRLVKKKVKDKDRFRWEYRRRFREDELE